ncbi:MAG: hypothetical protein ABJO27_19120 [Pseudoruegeria sp.]
MKQTRPTTGGRHELNPKTGKLKLTEKPTKPADDPTGKIAISADTTPPSDAIDKGA